MNYRTNRNIIMLLCVGMLSCSMAFAENSAKGKIQQMPVQQYSIEQVRKEGEKGKPEFQVIMVQAYAMGHGMKQDRAKAVKWHKKSAEKNNPVG